MIRGQTRKLEHRLPEVEAKMDCAIHNRFDIEVIDSLTGEVKQRAQAENVILNQLWTRLLSPSTYFNYIFIGTGIGTPSAPDTALFSHLGYKYAVTPTYTYNWDAGWVSVRKQCQISEAEYVGSTLTEVGIGYGTVSSNLVTHAMLKDMNGNTITISKTNTDIINIYATVFVHWNVSGYDQSSIKVLGNLNNNFILSYLLGGATTTGIQNTMFMPGGITSVNGNEAGNYYSVTNTISYNAANRTIKVTAARVPAAGGNIGGIRSLALYGEKGHYLALTVDVGGSWFSGTNVVGEAIATGDGTTKDFASDFGFVAPGAKVYVNGVEQASGVTVDTGMPIDVTNMGKYFRWMPLAAPPVSDRTIYMFGPAHSFSSSTDYITGSDTAVYYNPYFSYGIANFYTSSVTVYASDDLVNWVQINTGSGTITVPSAYRSFKYWKFKPTSVTGWPNSQSYKCNAFTAYSLPANIIHFTTAPASGAVITADYTTASVAKDSNHVFDFSLTITLGEKTT